jgi:peptidoglycan hydrolase-like protein with peptidoglycan-binding domain
MNNGLKWALVSLPILVGGFIVYRTLTKEQREAKKKAKEQGGNNTPIITSGGGSGSGSGSGSGGGGSTIKPDFPMGIGSRGSKVKELQQAIVDDGQPNVVSLLGKNPTDGQFGTGTEKAVKALLGKTKIDSQADIDKIKGLKATRSSQQNTINKQIERIALANRLIATFNSNPSAYYFYSVRRHSGTVGNVTSDGRQVRSATKVWQDGEKVGFTRYAKFKVDRVGNITATDGDKFAFFNPEWVEVK